jgi:hypothetical protein
VQEEEYTESEIFISWTIVGFRISRSGGTSTTKILIGGHCVLSRGAGDEQPRERDASFTGPNISKSDILRYLLPAVRPLGRFAFSVFRQIRIEEVCGNIRIGLGDPVATGMLYGGYWASRFAMNASRIFVDMEPVFEGRVVACDLTIRLKLRHPLVILIGTVTLLRDPAVRKLREAFRTAPPVSVSS